MKSTADPRLIAPAIFWFWNRDPTRESVEHRLDAFLDRGFRSVYIHPMSDDFRPADFHGGMTTAYLSPAFFDLIAMTCEQMRRRDMTLWLYDESGWPSGRAGGLLVDENPALSVRGLRRRNGYTSEVDFRDECDYPDLMNPDATRRFIELTHERYRAAVGNAFGKTILGIFTDEPRLLGRVGSDTIPWSPTLPEAFEAKHGYPLADALGHLFEVKHPDDATHRARRDYLQTVSDLIAQNYFDPIRQWCDEHCLIFEGHHTGEDEFAKHGQYFGHYLQQAKRYHVPGVDTIWRQIFPGQSGGNFVALASSRAWLDGNRVALSELFAAYGQGLTLEQMRWVSAQHLVRGVNRHGLMASLESADGPRRLGTCSDFSFHDPRWRDLDLYLRFVDSAAAFTLRGQPITDVAMFYRTELIDGEAATAFDAEHELITDAILDWLHPLFFVGEDDLARAAEMGVRQLIVHPDAPLDASEIVALRNAEAAGMRVDHVKTAQDVSVIDSPIIQDVSRSTGVRALPLRADDGGVELMLFNQGDAEVDFAFTWHAQPLAELPLDDDATLDLRPLRREGGASWGAGGSGGGEGSGRCRVLLLPGELRAWVAAEAWPEPTRWTPTQTHPLDGGWRVRAIEQLTIGQRPVVAPVDEPDRDVTIGDLDSARSMFSGTLEYTHRIAVKIRPDRRYVLDLDRVFDACEVSLDGEVVARRAWSPWRVDVTEAVRSGARALTVRVTNTAAGAWMDPALHERDLHDTPNMYLKTAAPFMRESCRAGLAQGSADGPRLVEWCNRRAEAALAFCAPL